MKKFLSLLILLDSLLFAQWTWLNPTPQGNKLAQLITLSNGTLIAAGECGTIITSTNGGSSWNVQHQLNDTCSPITTIFRVNDNLIFSGSWEGKIIKSTNGGISWNIISRITNVTFGLTRLFFVNQDQGYALVSASIYKTSNGGLNWIYATLLPQPFINDIYFTDVNTGYAGGGYLVDNSMVSYLYKSINGGLNWSAVNLPADYGEIMRIKFVNSSTGYYSAWGRILKTTNAGINWTVLNVGGIERLYDFQIFDENNLVAGSRDSYFYKTTDGGLNWTTVNLPYFTFNTTEGITSISFSNISNGYILLNKHVILRTSDGSSNWTRITNSMNQYVPLTCLQFINTSTGFLGGYGTTNDYIIRKTTNGGISWTGVQASNYASSTGYIYDIGFPSFQVGYAVGGGSKGYIWKTTNGGDNWIKKDSMGTGSNYKACFTDINTGFVLGYNTEIFKTSDGGNTWSTFMSNVTFRLNSIWFTSLNTGYACGGNATQKLLKTTDAGSTWNQIYSTTGSAFNDIRFINPSTGFIAGKGIIMTTDGGITWIQKQTGDLIFFQHLNFVNSNIGYALANFGRIFKTNNSGESWGEQFSPTSNNMTDSYFFDVNTGFVVGDQGMILKTTNGGGNYIGIKNNNNNVPSVFKLFQNYPNPFNPITRINYELPVSGYAQLNVYDILGRLIVQLVGQNQNPGSYSVDWNAEENSSGIYFYELQAGKFVDRKKMVLVK